MPPIKIIPLNGSPQIIDALSHLLVAVVADGASVNFMHPMPLADAETFWGNAFLAAGRGERIILGAFDSYELVATVTLIFIQLPNQLHRAEIGKMMTHASHRGRGIARALMQAAECIAIEHNRTLLVLDTAEEDGATKFYERLGYNLAGVIPGFAHKPHGGLTGSVLLEKY